MKAKLHNIYRDLIEVKQIHNYEKQRLGRLERDLEYQAGEIEDLQQALFYSKLDLPAKPLELLN